MTEPRGEVGLVPTVKCPNCRQQVFVVGLFPHLAQHPAPWGGWCSAGGAEVRDG